MIWKLVIFVSLSHYQIQCKPVSKCADEASLAGTVNIPEFPLSEESDYSTEILEKDSQQISNQCQCCNPPVLVKCGNQGTQLPAIPKLSKNEGDKFLSSILRQDSTNHPASYEPVQLSYSKDRSLETVCSASEQTRRASHDEQRATDRRNRMFEGLLKLTTILNRFDTFITKKAKGLLKGIHSMMESEEDEGKYY